MLTYSDRQKFEQIRARWETAQPTSDKPRSMAGRKEKPVAHQPLDADPNNGSGSKFRRKLSHGLSFISNPLSQRKTTPGRIPLGRQSLAPRPSAITINTDSIAGPRESDRLLSPVCDSPSSAHSCGSPMAHTVLNNGAATDKNRDPDATPKPLPRSRTMSFIPRPSKSESESESSIMEPGSAPKPRSPPFTHSTQARTSLSKIPSPPATKRRLSSPRQYATQQTTQQTKHVAASMAFAGVGDQSPSKASVRSSTNPNLVKSKLSPQSGSFMMPRKSALRHTHSGSPGMQRPPLKENHIPTGEQGSYRMSEIQDRYSRRESLAVPTVASTRRSFVMSNSPGQSKQAPRTTLTTTKQSSTSFSGQTPWTARRSQPNKQLSFQPSTSHRSSVGSSIVQPRLMGPVDPPTPQVVDQIAAQPTLRRASTDRDLRRRTFTSTPSGKSDERMSSRSLAGPNSEVRLLRSSTFHNLRSHCDPPPPVPAIPEKYRSLSQPLLVLPERTEEEDSIEEGPRLSSISEHEPVTPCPNAAKLEEDIPTSSSPFIVDLEDTKLTEEKASEGDVSWPLGPAPVDYKYAPSKPHRPWSIHDRQVDSADSDSQPQVNDSMPPLWWAGRFQSRFDQWRTQAMMAEINPYYKVGGMLGRYSLNQDKTAACYIFLQLRDLCASDQAADSLWEFEYKYRQDHKLLGEVNIPSYPERKLDDDALRGPIGRAVRKLTPRKSSLVNLLRGIGWNRAEGATEHAMPSATSRRSSSGKS